MPHSTPPTLSADTIDDLIYFSRAGDLESLQESITSLSTQHSTSAQVILSQAIDLDESGSGSGSSLLHYPAANGSLAVVGYLLSLLEGADPAVKAGVVNHQNTSGNTALHWAAMNGHLAVVQALVKAGADPAVVNAAGRDAVVESEWSAKEGWAECAVWMLQECPGLEKGVGGGDGSGNEGDGQGTAHDENAELDSDESTIASGSGAVDTPMSDKGKEKR